MKSDQQPLSLLRFVIAEGAAAFRLLKFVRKANGLLDPAEIFERKNCYVSSLV